MVSISSWRDIFGTTLYANVTYNQDIILARNLEATAAQGNLLLDYAKEMTAGNINKMILFKKMLGLVDVSRGSIVAIKIDKVIFEQRQALKLNTLQDVKKKL